MRFFRPAKGEVRFLAEAESPVSFSPLLSSMRKLPFARGSIPPDEEGIVPHPDENPMTQMRANARFGIHSPLEVKRE